MLFSYFQRIPLVLFQNLFTISKQASNVGNMPALLQVTKSGRVLPLEKKSYLYKIVDQRCDLKVPFNM